MVVFDVAILMSKGQEMIDQCQPELAIKFYEKAHEQEPRNSQILDAMGDLYMELQCPQDAYRVLQDSIELEPDANAQKWLNLSQLVEGVEAEKYGEKAIQLLQSEYASAERHQNLEEMTLIRKQICAAYSSLAELYMTDLCDLENAEAQCETFLKLALQYDTGSPEPTQALANLRLTQNRVDEAKTLMKSTFERLCECDENELPTLEFRIFSGKLLIEVGEFESAADVLEAVMLEDDENAELWFLVGQCYLEMQEETAALEFFEKCQEMLLQLKQQDAESFQLDAQLQQVMDLVQRLKK